MDSKLCLFFSCVPFFLLDIALCKDGRSSLAKRGFNESTRYEEHAHSSFEEDLQATTGGKPFQVLPRSIILAEGQDNLRVLACSRSNYIDADITVGIHCLVNFFSYWVH